MSLDDDSQPRSDATQGLPASASYRLRVARRPTAARIITAVGALLGGLIAACVTVVATSGVCLDGQANCYGLGEQTIFFCLFTVPIGAAVGVVVAGAQVDKLLGS